jgi:hypothetical protein
MPAYRHRPIRPLAEHLPQMIVNRATALNVPLTEDLARTLLNESMHGALNRLAGLAPLVRQRERLEGIPT